MKNLLNLGKVLKKEEQKTIIGGGKGGKICCEWERIFDDSLNTVRGECIDWQTTSSGCAFTHI